MKKALKIMAFFLGLALFAGLAQAAVAREVALKGGPAGKGASGVTVIKDTGQDRKQIEITARGLKPDSVYTVWLVNMKPKMDMTGVGTGDFSFKSDARGNGSYTASVPASELARWQMFEIAYHPDADPMNMKNMGIALMGSLK